MRSPLYRLCISDNTADETLTGCTLSRRIAPRTVNGGWCRGAAESYAKKGAPMDDSGRDEQIAESSRALYQRIARSANEAARLKAAHRYFQRTNGRPPFRLPAVVSGEYR